MQEIEVQKFSKYDLQCEIDKLILELTDKDCSRVEFLRGKLSVYKEILNRKAGWVKDAFHNNDYFK